MVLIDSCCATYAEYKKRGMEFWPENELVIADVLIGVAVDIILVGFVFEAERPGCKFSAMQRITTYFYKGALYGFVGFRCGLIGQAIANMIMNAKRSVRKSKEHIPVPPFLQSAALWGFFLALSLNTRYQLINGLERLVETSHLSKKFSLVTMAFTIGVRYRNNNYGGMQFVDWAK
ncbi:hypothetical protein PIB30_020730 [Stylosanthes scabra]|uniref:Uncharacterized protein n=1 Tax=Stylosanthes scabra TaxID=79078 RepID=A0ABU6Y7B6_9FABA|nr:hypothetical protein [Stylosanthes scabra]